MTFHELCNPLNATVGYLQLAHDAMESKEALHEELEHVQNALVSCKILLTNLNTLGELLTPSPRSRVGLAASCAPLSVSA